MKRKDMLIKELQYKLEHNEGCEYQPSPTVFSPLFHNFDIFDLILRVQNHVTFDLFPPLTIPNKSKTFSQKLKDVTPLCLVIVMRTAADDKNDGSSSTSCVVDSKIEKETKETVGVNNCVNISSNYDQTSNIADNDFLISDRSTVDDAMPIYECIADELDDMRSDTLTDHRQLATRPIDTDDDILNKFLSNDDDDALTSSKYSDVTSRCDMLQPSTSSTLSNDNVVTGYASTRDNNQKHQKAVRKNFSLWIGVTSCVWGLLLLLMKNYVD
jgi:hypothetical protein